MITGSPEDFFIQGLAGSGSCLPFLPPLVINVLNHCLPEELAGQPWVWAPSSGGWGPGEPRAQATGQMEIVWEVLCICQLLRHFPGLLCLPSRTGMFSVGAVCLYPFLAQLGPDSPRDPSVGLVWLQGDRVGPHLGGACRLGLCLPASDIPGHKARPVGSAEAPLLTPGPLAVFVGGKGSPLGPQLFVIWWARQPEMIVWMAGGNVGGRPGHTGSATAIPEVRP